MHQSKKSSGEVAAIMGYEFQYSIFATEIYNALLNDKNQIEWIEFASNNAGKIDDVLIGLENSILAFQVKDIGSSSFSYKTFTYSDTQSILEGMFSGWQKIKSTYPKKKIDVRFITTQSVSENDKIEAYSDKKKPSFKEFLNKLWNPIAENRYEADNLPLKWQAVFQEMVSKVNCSKLEFVQFVKNTTFVFDYSLPKQFDSYIERQRRIDIEDITKNIFQTVSKKGSIRFDKKSFLEHFGLLGRYETYYTHSFFVDEEHYQPINETIAQLDKLITDYPKGYISLVGNAGSGKSTLLTKWLQRSNYVILKYYAYTNTDMSYEFGFRGEAKTFLHDILIQIRQAKHSIQERLPTDDFTDLQKHFNEELNKLSKENTKVIIVVDGLDHIEREQDVATSLLGVLPLPDNIPENIYFILGTRTIENLEKLHTRIKNTIKEDGRVIIIKPLSKTQIQSFLSTYQIVLSADLLEMLFVNTKGHPLFLRYTIEEIRSKGGEHLEELISQRVFSGDIYNEYKVFWERYKKQDDFIQILGIISRFRHSFFNIEILSMFPRISRENQYNVNKLSENYFYKIGTTWQFFHNSFKEFLITETSRNIFTGSFDKTSDIGFHLRIVEAINGIESDYKWNNIYHLYKAEEFGRITELANQDYFRKQWFDFRNRNLIKEDIQFSINSANKLKDVYCLFRCLLSIFELKQRYTNFDPSHYFTTFHQLGKIALANSFVYDNIELLVSPKNALSYSVILYEQGYKELSYDIYLRAIPSYILNQSKIVSPRRYERNTYQEVNEIELVLAWVRAACLFTPLDDIFSKIRELTVGEENQPDRERDLFAEASSEILGISVRVKNWANLKALEKILQTSNKRYNLFYFYFDIVNKLTGEDDFYGYCLQVLQSWEITEDNPINRRLLIVNLLITKNSEKTNLIFSKLLPPNRVEKPDYSINEHDYLYYIFDYSRFFYITKKDFTISSISFLPTGNKHTKTAFYYALAELGKSYAYVYHDYKDAAIGYCLNLENALKLFHYSHADSAFEYSVSENKPLLVKLILEISSKASLDVFNRILEILGTEWEVNKRYWDTKHIHEVIEWVYTSGLNNKWCVSQLEKIDTYIFEEGYLDDRITNGIGQIRLWSKAGLINKGEAIFNHIMNISLDVRGEKDYQLDYIVEWIELLSADMSKEISFYLKRVRLLREKVNSPSHTPSRELLRMALKYGNGFEISKYLLFEGLVDFCDNMEEVLTYLSTSLPQYKRLLVKLYIRIILAYDNSQHTRYNFFKNLFERLPQISTDELRELVRQVSIYSISEYKNNYLLKVQEYAAKKNIDLSSIGLNDKIVIKEEYTQTKTDELKLEDGTILSLSDLLERVTTVEQLNEIKQKAIPQSDFNWINLYSKNFKFILR
ncbi:MAG: ATP-binding protein [Chitinophagaceae bacterium]